jgi:Tfp pilus assembly protein PilN
VPWMQSKEIKSVVEFEATKYIPFSLKELAYSYHAMNITVDGSRRLRIIFIAIKKETLKKYTKLLEESALKIKQIEPSPISLVRTLVKKQLLAENEIIAIIEKMEKSGKIIIVQENTPLFVREFQLAISSNPALDKTVDTGELLRLTNEVRISLDYFNRLERNINVSRIIYISSEDSIQEYAKLLKEDLELPTEPISSSMIFDNAEIIDSNFLSAYGASLQDEVSLPANIDLSKEAPQTIRIASQAFKKSLDLKEVFPIAVFCTLLMITSLGSSKYLLSKQHVKKITYEEQLGDAKYSSIEKLQFGNDLIQKKLDAYSQVRLKSNTRFILESILTHLPEGTWINSLNYNVTETIPSPSAENQEIIISNNLDISGSAYAKTKREQFQLINNLLQNLKDSEKYKLYFKDIKLENVRSDTFEGHPVTNFIIRFQ